MKKTLLFLLLFIFAAKVFANDIIGNWRWRNNDGTEKTATWKAPQDSIYRMTDLSTVRLRIHFALIADIWVNSALSYSTAPNVNSPTYLKNNTTGVTDPFVLAGKDAFVQHGEPSTQQMPAINPGTTFTPGVIITRVDSAQKYVTASDLETEIEWVVQPTKYVMPGTAYYFTSNNMSGMQGLPAFAVLVTSNDVLHPGDKITGGSLTTTGNQLVLNFTTALAGHDHYDLQYSRNDTAWTTYKTLPGDNLYSHHYAQAAASKPAPGTIYLRILLYDLNDNMSISAVITKTVNPDGTIADLPTPQDLAAQPEISLNVYPNPGTATINFDLKNYSGKTFTVTLTSLYGKQVGRQTLGVSAGGHYSLPSNATPGTYILNINGENLAKSSRVMVQ